MGNERKTVNIAHNGNKVHSPQGKLKNLSSKIMCVLTSRCITQSKNSPPRKSGEFALAWDVLPYPSLVSASRGQS